MATQAFFSSFVQEWPTFSASLAREWLAAQGKLRLSRLRRLMPETVAKYQPGALFYVTIDDDYDRILTLINKHGINPVTVENNIDITKNGIKARVTVPFKVKVVSWELFG